MPLKSESLSARKYARRRARRCRKRRLDSPGSAEPRTQARPSRNARRPRPALKWSRVLAYYAAAAAVVAAARPSHSCANGRSSADDARLPASLHTRRETASSTMAETKGGKSAAWLGCVTSSSLSASYGHCAAGWPMLTSVAPRVD